MIIVRQPSRSFKYFGSPFRGQVFEKAGPSERGPFAGCICCGQVNLAFAKIS